MRAGRYLHYPEFSLPGYQQLRQYLVSVGLLRNCRCQLAAKGEKSGSGVIDIANGTCDPATRARQPPPMQRPVLDSATGCVTAAYGDIAIAIQQRCDNRSQLFGWITQAGIHHYDNIALRHRYPSQNRSCQARHRLAFDEPDILVLSPSVYLFRGAIPGATANKNDFKAAR